MKALKVIISIGAFKVYEILSYLSKGYIVEAYDPRRDVYKEYLKINNKRFFPFDFAVLGNKTEDEIILNIIKDEAPSVNDGTNQFCSSSTHYNGLAELVSGCELADKYLVKTISACSILEKHIEIEELHINCEGEEVSIIMNTSIDLFRRCKKIYAQIHIQKGDRYSYLCLPFEDIKRCTDKLSKYFEVKYIDNKRSQTAYEFDRF